jgi:hypothetical protein
VKSRKIKNRRRNRTPANEILPEYNFSGAQLNKYAARYRAAAGSIQSRAVRRSGKPG